jgi:membrane associated rhomboid family serine protease
MVGASGAIAGVLGAYLALHPRARVLALIPLGFFTRLIHVPAFLVLGLWFALQFLSAPMTQAGGGVAYWAHVGGFVAGAALIFPFRRRGVALFDRGQPRRSPRFGASRRRGPWG